MPRPPRNGSIDEILHDVASRVVSRVSAALARQVGDLVKEGVQRELNSSSVRRATTPSQFRPPLLPFWGRVRPFVMTSQDQFRCPPPESPLCSRLEGT